jgi:S-adenosylmethionine:tRNA ribosyltransferase-isomerase
MKDPRNISIEDYNYELPDSYIASHPVTERDSSRLLITKNGQISEDVFRNISDYLPENSLLVFNDTRVVQARLEFFKESGARIELFCLEPAQEEKDIQIALSKNSPVRWKCFVGNAKRWKNGLLKINNSEFGFELSAEVVRVDDDVRIIEFSWEPAGKSFSEILEIIGKTPLPPYIERKPVAEDKNRYQTIYAHHDGSVAAPTAGLHFSEAVFEKMMNKNIDIAKVTLHVGAGTFKPVSSENIGDHFMHAEKIVVSTDTLLKLKQNAKKIIISVGTTSARTLETIYWWGVKLKCGFLPKDGFFELNQWFPYEFDNNEISLEDSIDALLDYIKINNVNNIKGQTELIIVPSYKYRLVDILITNFHQPRSTLLLLVAAFIGGDWLKAYKFAIDRKFRFLSYGDSCLFFYNNSQKK